MNGRQRVGRVFGIIHSNQKPYPNDKNIKMAAQPNCIFEVGILIFGLLQLSFLPPILIGFVEKAALE